MPKDTPTPMPIFAVLSSPEEFATAVSGVVVAVADVVAADALFDSVEIVAEVVGWAVCWGVSILKPFTCTPVM